MDIHIGQIIKEALKAKGMEVTEFAAQINYARSNAYKIFSKPSIDTQLLIKISNVLGKNLFLHYITDEELVEYKNSKVKSAELMSALKDLKATMIRLNEEKDSQPTIKEKLGKKGKKK